MNVGYIGLGALGNALARQLLSAHSLHVWDVNGEAVREFVKLGARAALSAEDIGWHCDVVFMCLPRSDNVGDVLFGATGLAATLAPGTIVIDQTSGIPAETRAFAQKLAGRGVAMIDAPVSGSPQLVLAGGCTIMTSGPATTLARALPVLHAITQNVLRCGDRVGDAQAMKLVNNTMNAGCRLATLEAVAMGRKRGLTLTALTKVLNAGAGRNLATKNMLPALVEGRASTRFALALMLKDLNQANALASDQGAAMTVASLVRGLLQVGVNTLGAHAQLEDVVGLIESMAATRLVDANDESEAQPPEPTTIDREPQRLMFGYVGVGAAGEVLASRFASLGDVQVYGRNDEAMHRTGTTPIGEADLRELACASDVVAIWAPEADDMEQILFGARGLAGVLEPGKSVVDLARRDPDVSRRFAGQLQSRSVALIDAPLGEEPNNAAAPEGVLVCGGAPQAYARILPVLRAMGGEAIYCGPPGNGQMARLVDDVVAACAWRVTCETAALGLNYGLSADVMDAVLNRSSGWSGESERLLPRLAAELRANLDPRAGTLAQLERASRIGRECGAPILIANAVRTFILASA